MNKVRETDLTIDLLFQSLRDLLESKEPVTFFNIPEALHDDLFHFLIGKTVNIDKDERVLINKTDLKNWIDKLRDIGFDYELKVKY